MDDLFKSHEGLRLFDDDPETHVEQVQSVTHTQNQRKQKSHPHRIVAHSLATGMHKTFAPVVPMIEDFLPEQSVNILHGHPGHGKSKLINQIVKCRADGTDFLGQFPTTQGRVFHLALEYPERDYIHDMQKLGIQHWENVDYLTEDDMQQRDLTLDDVEIWCQANPGELVIIDMYKNIAKKRGRHWTIEERFHALYNPLKLFVPKYQVTIVAVAHSNDLGRLYGGPSASGRIDNVYVLTKDGKQPELTTATLVAFKARTAVPATYRLKFNETIKNWDLVPEIITPGQNITPELQRIYDFVARTDKGISMQEISRGLGKNHNTTRVQVRLLLQDNFLRRDGTLYYAVLDAD